MAVRHIFCIYQVVTALHLGRSIISDELEPAIEILKAGGLVAVPTETVYGLAGNGVDAAVVSQIFEVKNRPTFDPMILHFPDLESMEPFVKDIPAFGMSLANEFWPGPMTLLLEKTDLVPDIVTAGSYKVAVRVSSHPMLLSLLQSISFPLAAPSANPFGYISPTTAQHVDDQLGDKIAYILDGGPCEVGLESTIVDVTMETPTVLRKGGVTIEDIIGVIGSVTVKDTSTSQPSAPGMLHSHYSPRTPFYVIDKKNSLDQFAPEEVGVIAFDKLWDNVPSKNQIVLSEKSELKEAAQKLFASMREMDSRGFKVIFSERFPDIGLGRAMNDKLLRASTKDK